MKFWTSFQAPLFQAALVEDGRVVRTIPTGSAPLTPARKVGVVGQWDDDLVLLRHSSWERWSSDGVEERVGAYHPLVYGPHAVEQVGDELLVCGSGHDTFFTLSAAGEVTWEWRGCDYGAGGKPMHLGDPDWTAKHVVAYAGKPEGGWHYNSIWLEPGGKSFLAGALTVRKVVRITIYGGMPEIVHEAKDHGMHSPIFHDGRLIYGLDQGIWVDGTRVLPELEWVKYIRWLGDRFVLTHERGVTFADERFQVMREMALPRPFRVAWLEM